MFVAEIPVEKKDEARFDISSVSLEDIANELNRRGSQAGAGDPYWLNEAATTLRHAAREARRKDGAK
jgi:hypothetical protein